jgi:hypothetical protein
VLKTRLLIFILIFGFFNFGKSQINDYNIRLLILRKNLVGKEFVFGKWNEKGGTETHLTYLGKVRTRNGKIYKIINSLWIWGLSSRATSRILIFNGKNQYLGNYSVSTDCDLPTKLKNGNLIFENLCSECDKNVVSKVSFKNGLPKKFFRECNNKYGDIYSFDGTN